MIIMCGAMKTLFTNNYHRPGEEEYDLGGLFLYSLFWVFMLVLWKVFVQTHMTKKSDYAESITSDEQETGSDSFDGNTSDSIDDSDPSSVYFTKGDASKDILSLDGGDEYLSLVNSYAARHSNYATYSSIASTTTPPDVLSQSSDEFPSLSVPTDLDTVRHG